MNRRNFLGMSLKAAVMAPIAAVATVIDTPDPLLGKDKPLIVQRDIGGLVDGVALISNNTIIATKRFSGGGRTVIPGDELNIKWKVHGSVGGRRLPDDRVRKFALKKIAEKQSGMSFVVGPTDLEVLNG